MNKTILKKFELIKKAYSEFESELEKQNKRPMRNTSCGFWGCSRLNVVFDFFNKINLQKYRSFLDLGSGDGRIVLTASLFTNATGIEADKELFEKSIEMNDKMKMKAKFINKDYMKVDFSDYDFIYIFPDKFFHMALEEKIKKEFNGIVAVYNNVYLPNLLERKQTTWIEQTPIVIFNKSVQ